MFTRRTYVSDYRIGYRRHNRLRIVKFAFWSIILLFFLFFIIKVSDFVIKPESISKNIISPLAKDFIIDAQKTLGISTQNLKLAQIIEGDIKDKEGTYAVGVLNIKTGDEYFYNKHKIFDSASLYKLWVMGLVYQDIENGQLTKNKILSADVKDLNNKFDISDEEAEKTDGVITESVGDALNQMITISDNYSALLLSSYTGIPNLNNYINQIGLYDSKTGGANNLPVTSVYDAVTFLYKLYNGELGSEVSTNEMLNLLKSQKLNEKLPKYLPESITVAHKTGELGSVSHDAGIVYLDNGPYIIAVLSDTSVPDDANEVIANISKDVYNYFANN